MKSLPIFDSNAHPTVDGKWFGGSEGIGAPELRSQMLENDIRLACAVGMWGVGGYDNESFVKMCSLNEGLIPIAGINPSMMSDPGKEIQVIQTMGFTGVKIHPRSCKLNLDSQSLAQVLTVCSEKKMPVFLCTYHWEKGESLYKNNFDAMLKLISDFDELPMVLLHGGVHDILKLSEVARYYSNIILDLSFTILKYEGSSLDMDIEYLFHQFDRRICIGSDQPEYDYRDLRRRFEFFSRDITEEKARNIAYKNLAGFLGVTENVFKK